MSIVGIKESLHDGDLEPGASQRYREVQDKLGIMLQLIYSGSTDWIWFIADILDWLRLRVDTDHYNHTPSDPWPHSFIAQDLAQAYTSMAMFFPELDVTALVANFLRSKQAESFRSSLLFNPEERSKSRPDRRGRTSYMFRNKDFWTEWKEILGKRSHYTDIFPMDWSTAIRPIIAHRQCPLL